MLCKYRSIVQCSKELVLLICIVRVLGKYSKNTVIRLFVEDSHTVLLFMCTLPFQY
jgi:hypothetical protein